MEDAYLGDGVYASWDGYHVVLDLRAQDNTTRISLEPSVFDALIDYRKSVQQEIKRRVCKDAEENAGRVGNESGGTAVP
jgi:hypothetical protein